MAYRSFNFTSFKLEVSEKLPQGLTNYNLSVPGDGPLHRLVRQYLSSVLDIVISCSTRGMSAEGKLTCYTPGCWEALRALNAKR